MKVSGFTFVKNAIIYDYPIVEAIQSILPICDEVVVAVGRSEDETLQLVQGIDPSKVRIVETEWDETLREGGKVLAVETDKAFQAISPDSDWAFYIQGDEVQHEKYLPAIETAMRRYKDEKEVDGLLFDYLHFFGSYDYVGASWDWYKNEVRVVRNDPTIRSFRDAQGFRIRNNELLKVRKANACMYHYGWVKDPRAMQLKQENFNKLWHDDQWVEENVAKSDSFDYTAQMRSLGKFEGTHPAVMLDRIAKKNWQFDHDISFNKRSLKDAAKDLLLKYFKINPGYQNYILKR